MVSTLQVSLLTGLMLAQRVIYGAISKSQKNSVTSHLSPCSKEIVVLLQKSKYSTLDYRERKTPILT